MIKLNENKAKTTPRYFMILSLPIGLFILLLLGFIDYIPFKVELHSVIIVFIIFLIFLSFIAHNAWYSFAYFKNSISEVLKQIDKEIEKNRLTLANKEKGLVDIEPFFNNYIGKIRNDNFANVASSIFPTLGILGTFLAIAISMPDFTVDSKDALESEITILLSGVGTAFYASIYGIFLSLWWVFFEKRGLTKIENEINDIKAQYLDLIWNKEEIELYKILEGQEQNKKFVEKIESVVTPEFLFKLDEIAKVKLEQIERLNEEFKESEEKVTKNYLDLSKLIKITSSKQEEILENFVKIQETVERSSVAFEKSVEESQRNSKAVNTEIYSVLSSFELVSRDLKALGKDLLNAK